MTHITQEDIAQNNVVSPTIGKFVTPDTATIAPTPEYGYNKIIIDLSSLNSRIRYLEQENSRLKDIIRDLTK